MTKVSLFIFLLLSPFSILPLTVVNETKLDLALVYKPHIFIQHVDAGKTISFEGVIGQFPFSNRAGESAVVTVLQRTNQKSDNPEKSYGTFSLAHVSDKATLTIRMKEGSPGDLEVLVDDPCDLLHAKRPQCVIS